MTKDEVGLGKLLNPDMPADQIRLHMGEMTAQEMRTARAAIGWANSQAANAITTLIAERDGAIAVLSGIVHFQGALTKAQFREAAADALAGIGRKPLSMADQSPFVTRALAAEAQLKVAREPFRNVDAMDWDYLLSLLGDGGRARFWKAVIGEVRTSLSDTKGEKA